MKGDVKTFVFLRTQLQIVLYMIRVNSEICYFDNWRLH